MRSDPGRLVRETRFVTALFDATRTTPNAWRSVTEIGNRAGILDRQQLEQAVADAEAAGLLTRQVSAHHLVILTPKGRVAAKGGT